MFGVPLVDLVAQEETNIPWIIRKAVEYIEAEGLGVEGIYRVNGNAKTIEALRASFDTIGDAGFKNRDIASIAGLLKLFLVRYRIDRLGGPGGGSLSIAGEMQHK